MIPLTTKQDWNDSYTTRDEPVDLKLGWRDYTNGLIAKKIQGIGLDGKKILEIGAGDSYWLPFFAKQYPNSRFAGLDYSPAGCEKLANRIAFSGLSNLDVYHQDMFETGNALHGTFDLVISFGLVEHFTVLSEVLRIKSLYLNRQGYLFTLIPNMAGSIGYLTKRFNRKVYEAHNPHDWHSFHDGHRQAGLTVIAGGYLGSSNFGVLSSCFHNKAGLSWHSYVFLSRLSKAVFFMENQYRDLPTSKLFSPYIYAISQAG
ncbi:MAG: hypothetical protein CTY24_12605 [Methylobacter sp.]|nr:MAG: hypothetical protein CTY24_12605 [Methylobacter sp.]